MLNLVEQQLVGPNGGQPLSFKNDFFGPLGDRITLISDFKKPIKEDSQRYLLGIALEDAKAFQATLNRIFEITQGAPKKREFQGTTIYDVDMPNMPNPNAAGAQPFKGSISFAVAKNTFFVTTDTTCWSRSSGRAARPWRRMPGSSRSPRRSPSASAG